MISLFCSLYDYIHHKLQKIARWLFLTSVRGSVAEWLACWTQAQYRTRVQIAAATLSGNSLGQTVHTHHASVHQVAKLVAALLRIARVTAGLAESNGSLSPGLWLTSSAGWLPRTGISSGTVRSAIEFRLPLQLADGRGQGFVVCGYCVEHGKGA